MNKEKHKIHAVANVVWRNSREIGRKMPPPMSTRFAATARFIEDIELALFSIVLYYATIQLCEEPNSCRKAEVSFLAPKLVLPKLHIGSKLYITDGIKIVADAEIIQINN